MKILYTSDLHGRIGFYQQLLKLTKKEKVDAVVIGGDILPAEGYFEDPIEIQRSFINNSLRPFLKGFKRVCPRIRIYIMMGNDDWAINMPLFEEMERNKILHLLHKRVYRLKGDFFLAGYGCVPPTPFFIKDWERLDDMTHPPLENIYLSCISTDNGISRVDSMTWFCGHKTIKEEFEEMAQLSPPKDTIYIIHTPPYGTALDMLQDETHCGSRSVSGFIEKYQPLLTLHGHIHESPRVSGKYMERIGRTVSINPGQDGERLQAVVFEIPDILLSIRHVEG
ncbi:MAG: metallophosphoesterase [Nitrospinota bacterium]